MKNHTRYLREDPKEIKRCYRKTCPTCGRGRWVGYHAMLRVGVKNCQPCSRLIATVKRQKVNPHTHKLSACKEVRCSECKKVYNIEKNTLYSYMKVHSLEKYLCYNCRLAKIKKDAEKERQKEIEFVKTLTENTKTDPLSLSKKKQRKLDYNGCAWEEESYIGGIISNAKRCKNWTACEKRRECSSKLCKIGWKSFTSDCKGFVLMNGE